MEHKAAVFLFPTFTLRKAGTESHKKTTPNSQVTLQKTQNVDTNEEHKGRQAVLAGKGSRIFLLFLAFSTLAGQKHEHADPERCSEEFYTPSGPRSLVYCVRLC